MSGLDLLFCTDYLPPSDGGVEHVVDQLARRLAAQEYDVGIFTLQEPSDSIDLIDHPDITVITARRIDTTDYVGLQSAVSPEAILSFRRALEAHDPDIVHVHNRFFFTSFLGLVYTVRSDRKLVTSLHLGTLDHLEGIGSMAATVFQSTLSRALVTRSDAVICVSEAVASVAEDLGADPTRTHIVRNAVDLERFTVDPGTFNKTLLYIGRLVTNNGPQDLLKAVPGIIDSHPKATINMVGNGPLQNDLEQTVSSLGIEKSVQFHGFVDDITEMYEAADVFCRPSYTEGLPLTLLESMATYTVPVVTPVAGSEEVVSDGKTGRFVDIGRPESITQTVNELFEDPIQLNEMAQSGRDHIEANLSWEQRTQDIMTVYESLRNE